MFVDKLLGDDAYDFFIHIILCVYTNFALLYIK